MEGIIEAITSLSGSDADLKQLNSTLYTQEAAIYSAAAAAGTVLSGGNELHEHDEAPVPVAVTDPTPEGIPPGTEGTPAGEAEAAHEAAGEPSSAPAPVPAPAPGPAAAAAAAAGAAPPAAPPAPFAGAEAGDAFLAALEALDPRQHALGLAHLLAAMAASAATDGSVATNFVIQKTTSFLLQADEGQLKAAAPKAAELCRRLADLCAGARRPRAGVRALRRAARVLAPGPRALGPAHAALLQLYLLGRCYAAAGRWLDANPVSEVGPMAGPPLPPPPPPAGAEEEKGGGGGGVEEEKGGGGGRGKRAEPGAAAVAAPPGEEGGGGGGGGGAGGGGPRACGLTGADYLLYFHRAGLALLGLGRRADAIEAFWLAVTAPATNISAIAVECYKKLILLGLLESGAAPALPAFLAPPVARGLRAAAAAPAAAAAGPYAALEAAFTEDGGSVEKIKAVLAEHADALDQDHNLGLAKQLPAALTQRRVHQVTHTYLTLSLTDIADAAKLPSATEAEKLILVMVSEGKIVAKIDKVTGIVHFDSGAEDLQSEDIIQKLEAEIKEAIEMAQRIRDIDATVSTNPQYISKAVRRGAGRAGGGGAAAAAAAEASGWGDVDMMGSEYSAMI